MSEKWNYGNAYVTHPIKPGELAVWENGSKVGINNIYDPLPEYLKEADVLFMDPPWNLGNLKSFYTKADRTDYPADYDGFYDRLFECIREIKPRVCYLEIGKEYLADFIIEMRKIYKYVTFYNSSYYHNKKNKCYVVRGSNKAKKPDLDYMDEEDIIKWVCENETYECIGDLCIGRGLVAQYAAGAGRKFVGGELNHKRLSVLLQKVPGYIKQEKEIMEKEKEEKRNKKGKGIKKGEGKCTL